MSTLHFFTHKLNPFQMDFIRQYRDKLFKDIHIQQNSRPGRIAMLSDHQDHTYVILQSPSDIAAVEWKDLDSFFITEYFRTDPERIVDEELADKLFGYLFTRGLPEITLTRQSAVDLVEKYRPFRDGLRLARGRSLRRNLDVAAAHGVYIFKCYLGPDIPPAL